MAFFKRRLFGSDRRRHGNTSVFVEHEYQPRMNNPGFVGLGSPFRRRRRARPAGPPTSGYTGSNVYGYYLSGDYENNLPKKHLTSTALNCASLSNVSLKFCRWLGVEQPLYDHAYVRVSNNGTNWTTFWQNSATVEDASCGVCRILIYPLWRTASPPFTCCGP